MGVDLAAPGAPAGGWPSDEEVEPLPQSLAKGCARWVLMIAAKADL